jgi:hypothetical protein
MLFSGSLRENAGIRTGTFAYDVSAEEAGTVQKQRNDPVWAIAGQYSRRD